MRWNLSGALLLVWAGSATAAPGDLPREVLLLARFKQQMRLALSMVPNYTCLETIRRSVQDPRAPVFSPLDTVQLEVTTLGHKELLAWPGARRFEEADLSSFASGGLMGSGIFALHARNVFLQDTTTIHYYGEEEMAGRTVARFDFRVPEMWSGYQIQANGRAAQVATAGSFWMDPAAMDLVRMEVRADTIPKALGIERTVTGIDYAPMRIGASEVLLPQDAKLTMTLLSGEVRRNDIEFSHCHEYQAESSIRFDMPDAPAPAAAHPALKVDLPGGLALSIELETAIDSTTARVGDPLRAHVIADVSRKGKAIIIPKGAVVTGRIRGLERVHSPGPGFDLTIELVELAWESTTAEFYGELLPKGAGREDDSLLNVPSINGALPTVSPPLAPASRAARAARIPGTGVLHVTGTRFRIAPGFRMKWRTLEPNRDLRKSR